VGIMLIKDHEYHGVELAQQLPEDIEDWLYKMFGPPDYTRWYVRHNIVYFASKLDHMLFLVRIS